MEVTVTDRVWAGYGLCVICESMQKTLCPQADGRWRWLKCKRQVFQSFGSIVVAPERKLKLFSITLQGFAREEYLFIH